jgi:hypothetical protein
MSEVLTRQKTIDEIIKEAEKPDQLQLQILLTKLRVKIMHKEPIKPVSNAGKKISLPSMEEIDQWKHESRK